MQNGQNGTIEETRRELVLANHILAREGLLAGLGHISARHPDDLDRFIMSSAISPNLVTPGELHEFDLDGKLLDNSGASVYAERVLHACIYKARPDVRSVCHNHAIEILPFCNAGLPPQPVTHLGALMGKEVPVWDNRDEFGTDTQIIVVKREEAESMTRALGANTVVLLRRHGAVVTGAGIRETVFRTLALRDNAKVHLQAMQLGPLSPLTAQEMEMSERLNLAPKILKRVWDGWVRDLGPAAAEVLRG